MWKEEQYAGVSIPNDCLPFTTEQHMLGTTIMAVEFDGGVVLGADSRTTTGAYIANRVSDKITPLSERIYCCRSGSAADTQAIADYVRYYLSIHQLDLDDLPCVKTAASICRELCYSNKDRLLAGIICAGWDPLYGGQVYTIPLGGTMIRQPYSIGGSGSTYIYGFCDAHFQKGMSREQCIDFTKKAVALAMARDGSSGGVIRLVVIEKQGVWREMIAGNQLPVISAE
ncbi:Proteasome subunit beta type-6 [Galdieria sulphuraria]|uniref:Proteasome subunit beta n=1 Tax=Galdieria sulphuraria TaxID=130081 RepID=M2WR55_GALSU|nr:20S proteasome subunit beta 1 [Galdieria sulphuraria]EME26285.1 20S proteasome subunit beta 1 [Galdieria sulphuraria]GJD09440.1 Proteasome subunit beta type-6 [Galdieria sulphuraria]|eukprot:XP_005702805.1 20S proteasome subunit beta 1 [Galdieria sulphuraria]